MIAKRGKFAVHYPVPFLLTIILYGKISIGLLENEHIHKMDFFKMLTANFRQSKFNIDHITLRPFDVIDSPMVAELLAHPGLTDYLAECGPDMTPKVFVDYYRDSLTRADRANFLVFEGCDSPQHFAGCIDIYSTHPAYSHKAIEPKTLSIGLWLAPAFQKKGWGKAIYHEMPQRIFNENKIDWLLCAVTATNTASRMLIEKSGFYFFAERIVLGQIDRCYIMNRNADFDYASLGREELLPSPRSSPIDRNQPKP